MAISFGVEELRTNREISFNGKGDQVAVEWTLEHRVVASVTGSDSLADVTEFDASQATGLPIVNRSIYYSENSGKIIPFFICRSKRGRRNDKKISNWTFKSTFKSFENNPSESGSTPEDPPDALTDITPKEQPFLEETERVLYQDLASTPKKIQLPSGAYFSESVRRRVPIFGLKLTQYEASLSYDDYVDRRFKFNDDTYRSKDAHSWIIENIEPSEATVQLSGGSTTAVLVTYTLLHNPLPEGWKRSLALIDYKHLVSGKFVPNMEGNPLTASLCFVDDTGAKKETQDVPDYVDFQQQDEIAYDDFLQA